MVELYTLAELSRRSEDLLPLFKGNSTIPVLFANDSHADFQGDVDGLIRHIKRTGSSIEVYQLCRATSKAEGESIFADLRSFRETDTGWETSLHEAAKADRRNSYQEFRDKNLPFLRMYMMGNPDLKIICPITNQQIDAWEFAEGILINIWEQHHFKVRNRNSVQKESDDPGEILRRMDFSDPSGETVEAIKDMMRTIFLSPTAHKAVHNTWNDSDIRNYPVERRPWALQSEDNWETWMVFLEERGYTRTLFGSHADWLLSLELTDADFAR